MACYSSIFIYSVRQEREASGMSGEAGMSKVGAEKTLVVVGSMNELNARIIDCSEVMSFIKEI